jgi:hypothetical protein
VTTAQDIDEATDRVAVEGAGCVPERVFLPAVVPDDGGAPYAAEVGPHADDVIAHTHEGREEGARNASLRISLSPRTVPKSSLSIRLPASPTGGTRGNGRLSLTLSKAVLRTPVVVALARCTGPDGTRPPVKPASRLPFYPAHDFLGARFCTVFQPQPCRRRRVSWAEN